MRTLADKGDAPSMKLFDDVREEAHDLDRARVRARRDRPRPPTRRSLGRAGRTPPSPRRSSARYLRDLRKLLDRYGYEGDLYGHFGQGCVHTRIDFDLETREGIAHFHAFLHDAAELVTSYGGSLSGEHGDGQSKAEFLTTMFGPELVQAFREFKAIWDPTGRMNPGKIVDPYLPTENLRIGTHYAPREAATHFRFTADGGSFNRAILRCVGVGNCRRTHGATMCPSFMATLEEKHSTRGRARLLFEMQQGEVLKDGWRSEAVREALDLCLACKGCKGDCPVHVDMATYKAEFMSHHYRGRLRPAAAYSMGLVYWWARAASHAPGLANDLLRGRPGAALKRIAGLAAARDVPRFARPTFRAWFARRREPTASTDRRVILWPDTFTNFFLPEPAKAAVAVLSHAGYEVVLPPRPLCCGRPLYDWGMLDLALGLWRQTLRTLRAEIEAGTPLVGLEPSCVAAFRDELPHLLPGDENAMRLAAQTFMLSEFLVKIGYVPRKLARKAIVHAHCNHRAVMGFDAEEAVLRSLGVDYRIPDPGVAVSRALSVSNARNTRFPCASASVRSFPQRGARIATSCSLPTASAAASRFDTAPGARLCISPKSSRSRWRAVPVRRAPPGTRKGRFHPATIPSLFPEAARKGPRATAKTSRNAGCGGPSAARAR